MKQVKRPDDLHVPCHPFGLPGQDLQAGEWWGTTWSTTYQ